MRDCAQHGDRHAERAECDRCGVEDEREGQGLQRREADRNQQCAGDGDRGAEPRDPLHKAPKQKATTTRITRRSFGRWSTSQSRNASKRPESTATFNSSKALTTIHITGQSANTAPAATGSRAKGNWKFPGEHGDDQADDQPGERRLPAGLRNTPSSARTATIGNAATTNDKNSDPATGVRF